MLLLFTFHVLKRLTKCLKESHQMSKQQFALAELENVFQDFVLQNHELQNVGNIQNSIWFCTKEHWKCTVCRCCGLSIVLDLRMLVNSTTHWSILCHVDLFLFANSSPCSIWCVWGQKMWTTARLFAAFWKYVTDYSSTASKTNLSHLLACCLILSEPT